MVPVEHRRHRHHLRELFLHHQREHEDPKPLLGKSYEWNADGTQLTIDLREGAKWSDGKPFTAKDVVFTLDMLKQDKSLNSIGYTGTAKAEGDSKVVVSFDEPSFVLGPNMLGKTWIVPEHLWKDIDPPPPTSCASRSAPARTRSATSRRRRSTLTANEDYGAVPRSQDGPLPVALRQHRRRRRASSRVRSTGRPPRPEHGRHQGNYPGYDGITIGQNQMALITCANTDLGCSGPQTDPAVRHAVADAINRKQLNSLAFANTASDISPTFALTTTQQDMISKEIEPAVMPDSPDTDAGRLDARGRRVGKARTASTPRTGRALADRRGRHRLDRLHHTPIDTMTQQLKAAGNELKAQQSSVKRVDRQEDQGAVPARDRLARQGPTCEHRTTSTTTTSRPRTPRRSARCAATNLSR